ncbi:Trichohyalin-like [Caenorhabditis elegans]|uniref:Trichohyalin-like n=1 Tax=Caenorhabditis elegans TaxID=6239 RepID=G5ECB0_CAEEL|nr:Trichohyalin-like [Caenorhabditis elegans]CAB82214.3 Trichohyalin-like [Caenorhabditis elegans]|eukprot:NP_507966.2 Uncharacterized protein CELE_F26F2.1 [Caenorhabditis elegans]
MFGPHHADSQNSLHEDSEHSDRHLEHDFRGHRSDNDEQRQNGVVLKSYKPLNQEFGETDQRRSKSMGMKSEQSSAEVHGAAGESFDQNFQREHEQDDQRRMNMGSGHGSREGNRTRVDNGRNEPNTKQSYTARPEESRVDASDDYHQKQLDSGRQNAVHRREDERFVEERPATRETHLGSDRNYRESYVQREAHGDMTEQQFQDDQRRMHLERGHGPREGNQTRVDNRRNGPNPKESYTARPEESNVDANDDYHQKQHDSGRQNAVHRREDERYVEEHPATRNKRLGSDRNYRETYVQREAHGNGTEQQFQDDQRRMSMRSSHGSREGNQTRVDNRRNETSPKQFYTARPHGNMTEQQLQDEQRTMHMETGYKTPNADQRRKNDKACQNQENYNDPRMTVNGDFHQRRNSFDSQQEERRLRGDERHIEQNRASRENEQMRFEKKREQNFANPRVAQERMGASSYQNVHGFVEPRELETHEEPRGHGFHENDRTSLEPNYKNVSMNPRGVFDQGVQRYAENREDWSDDQQRMYMEPGQRHREDHQTRVGNRGNGPYRGNSHNTSRADELHLQRRQTNNSQIHNQQFDDHFVDNRKTHSYNGPEDKDPNHLRLSLEQQEIRNIDGFNQMKRMMENNRMILEADHAKRDAKSIAKEEKIKKRFLFF